MPDAILEHVNFTVTDTVKTADMLCQIFDWKIRWQGDSIYDGHTMHVGGTHSYVALYTKPNTDTSAKDTYDLRGGLNHLGIIVDDLDATEAKVKAAGFETYSHGDYEPGRRFYFHDHDQIEYEVVMYD